MTRESQDRTPDPEIGFMETHHTWCSTCGDYFGNELYEEEHAEHDQGDGDA